MKSKVNNEVSVARRPCGRQCGQAVKGKSFKGMGAPAGKDVPIVAGSNALDLVLFYSTSRGRQDMELIQKLYKFTYTHFSLAGK